MKNGVPLTSDGSQKYFGLHDVLNEGVVALARIDDPTSLVQELKWFTALIQANHAKFSEADFLEDGATTTDEAPDFIALTPADEADIRGEAN